MSATRSLVVVTAITLFDVAWWAVMTTSREALLADAWALLGFGLFTVALAALTPVFFAALYWDAGHVRESASPWNPDRRRWVGGGILLCVAAYALARANLVGAVGLAYLLRRLRYPVRPTVEEATADDTDPDIGDRSVAGVAVHVLAVPTSVLGAGLVYAASGDEFTRENARNALNWHLPVLALAVTGQLLLTASADSGSGLLYQFVGSTIPAPANVVTFFAGLLLLLVAIVAWVAAAAFAVVAAVKAGRGSAWSYPLAPEVVSGNRHR